MLNNKFVKVTLYIFSWLLFSVIQIYAQGPDPKNDLKASVKGNNVTLEWTAPTSESVVAFNIYRAPITNLKKENMSNSKSSKTIEPSDLSFKKIGSTKDLKYIDKLEKVIPGKSGSFYYYVASVSKDGKETNKSGFTKVEMTTSQSQSSEKKLKTDDY